MCAGGEQILVFGRLASQAQLPLLQAQLKKSHWNGYCPAKDWTYETWIIFRETYETYETYENEGGFLTLNHQ